MSAARFIVGDSLTVLRTLPDASVDSVQTSSPYFAKRTYLPGDHPDKHLEVGQETTPADFLETVLTVADECARVLTPTGSMWWNLGDTAAFSGGSGGDYLPGGLREGQAAYEGTAKRSSIWARTKDGFPLARCKENPSVGELIDSVRVATEMVVFASLSGGYFYDLDAVRQTRNYDQRKIKSAAYMGHPMYREGQTRPDQACHPIGAPPLDWWVVNTAQYEGSHYAVMPEDLLDVPMRASVPERVCSTCSLPWERIVECETCKAHGCRRSGHAARLRQAVAASGVVIRLYRRWLARRRFDRRRNHPSMRRAQDRAS